MLRQGDCLELMRDLQDKSVDMILCDLPYGTTNCKWDTVIPFEPLWEQYKRVIKDNGAVVLFSAEPFTSSLITSNPRMFRYDLIWHKTVVTGFLNAKRMPLRAHENICVFYKRLPTYNPQFAKGEPYNTRCVGFSSIYGKQMPSERTCLDGKRYPTSVVAAKSVGSSGNHPTQKPVPLLEWLVKTYTNEGDTVLDNCMGSGSTGVACMRTGRDFIGYELDQGYYDKAREWITEAEMTGATV